MSSLAKCAPAQAGALSLKLVGDLTARLAVREHAVMLLAELHPPQSALTLSDALMDVLDYPGSDERAAGLMNAMARSLGKLRDPAGEAGLERALGEPLLPTLRLTALDALASLCTDRAKQSIAYAAKADDPALRRAAASATARCH